MLIHVVYHMQTNSLIAFIAHTQLKEFEKNMDTTSCRSFSPILTLSLLSASILKEKKSHFVQKMHQNWHMSVCMTKISLLKIYKNSYVNFDAFLDKMAHLFFLKIKMFSSESVKSYQTLLHIEIFKKVLFKRPVNF